jgi:hypothetical protein
MAGTMLFNVMISNLILIIELLVVVVLGQRPYRVGEGAKAR